MTMPIFGDGAVVHQTALNSLSTGIDNLSVVLTGVQTPRNYIPMAGAYLNAVKAIPNIADTVVTFDQAFSPVVNNDNIWVAGQAPFTIVTGGVYVAWAQVHFDANATGIREIHITLNGVNVTSNSVAAGSANAYNSGAGNAFGCITPPMSLAPGATLYLVAYQNSGAALNLNNLESGTFFTVMRVGN